LFAVEILTIGTPPDSIIRLYLVDTCQRNRWANVLSTRVGSLQETLIFRTRAPQLLLSSGLDGFTLCFRLGPRRCEFHSM